MRRFLSRLLFLGGTAVLLLTLVGCPGFFTPRNDNAAATPKFAYIANFQAGTSGSISIFTLNATTGALTSAGSNVSTGGTAVSNGPASLATVSGKFLYSANDGGSVSAFTINTSTGALTAVTGSPFTAGTNPNSVVSDPTAKFLYVADSGSKDIVAYTINSTTGALTVVGTTPAGSSAGTAGPAVGLAMHPGGKFLYVATDVSGIQIFSINASTGVLSYVGTTLPQSGSIQSVAIEKNGGFLYATDGTSAVEEFSVNTSTGALTVLGGSPVAAGTVPIVLTVDPTATHVYVANQVSNDVYSFGILTNGTLAQLSGGTVSAGASPSGIAIDPSGKFVYVTNFSGGPDISVYSIDSTGKLTLSNTQSTGVATANAAAIAFP